MSMNEETGLTKDVIFSGGTILLVGTTSLYSICRNSPLVAYDMGWQQRSSGNKYNSVSGHAISIGGYM